MRVLVVALHYVGVRVIMRTEAQHLIRAGILGHYVPVGIVNTKQRRKIRVSAHVGCRCHPVKIRQRRVYVE